jgi:hypothetical protein
MHLFPYNENPLKSLKILDMQVFPYNENPLKSFKNSMLNKSGGHYNPDPQNRTPGLNPLQTKNSKLRGIFV